MDLPRGKLVTGTKGLEEGPSEGILLLDKLGRLGGIWILEPSVRVGDGGAVILVDDSLVATRGVVAPGAHPQGCGDPMRYPQRSSTGYCSASEDGRKITSTAKRGRLQRRGDDPHPERLRERIDFFSLWSLLPFNSRRGTKVSPLVFTLPNSNDPRRDQCR